MENQKNKKFENLSLSIVIPVYQSQETLPQLAERLNRVLPQIVDTFEVIMVNDGSRDASWQTIENLIAEYEWLRGICLMRNYGQHNAILCGVRAAENEIIITMDDDLQHPPEEIPKLLEKIVEGFDVVYGTPEKESHGSFRNLASQMTKIVLQNGMGAEVARRVSAFRAFRAYVREGFDNYNGTFISIDVLLTWATTKFTWIYVRHEPRTIGTSNYNFGKLFTHAMNLITGFSTLPLQIASITGFVLTLFGIGILAFVIGRYLMVGSVVQGFPFLAATIAIFSGAQLFSLGIMGEYIGRIHSQTMNRPPYRILKSSKSPLRTGAATHNKILETSEVNIYSGK